MVIGAVSVAAMAVLGLVVALILDSGSGSGGGGDEAKGGGGSASASTSVVEGHRGPDTSKTIKSDECEEPRESYQDEDKIRLPDFRYKNIRSVKECLQAAGWKLKKVDVDENTYGQDTVLNQFPAADTDVDPKNMPVIQLDVSTGDPPSS